MEFDIIPDADYYSGIILTLYQDSENLELTDDLYPGEKGIHITLGPEMWETNGYDNITEDANSLTGQASKATVQLEKVNHVIFWVQNRRLRIYHMGQKVLDMNTNIHKDTKFNRFRFRAGTGPACLTSAILELPQQPQTPAANCSPKANWFLMAFISIPAKT